ncbi:MAG: aromatic ring-hydroxylating dioxygenase subunit alpha [Alphaproteobacteria bacterium]|nr:aromatic ring-hydroxylating dioxygenase subunit alpha [Alphaproteobacteria bacterium]
MTSATTEFGVDRALEADLERTRRPIGEATGLPNCCYTDAAHFELERARLFDRGWACIGFAKDIPEAGDALPIDHLGAPLLALRGKDGDVRVFHNVCSHRGMVLVEEPTRIRSVIRCPYHSWCYALDGALKATPHVGGPGQNADPAIDRSALGLRAVKSAVWFDLIFVDLSGQAPAFDTFIRPLAERWSMFDQDELRHAGADGSFQLEVHCNWKLAIENYCESYHLPWVHPGLNSYSRLEDHDNIIEPGLYSGQGTRVYNPKLSNDGRRFPDFQSLTQSPTAIADIWQTRAEYVALYPNTLLGIHRDHVFAIRLEPLTHERTREHVEIYFTSGQALGDDFIDLRAKLKAMWHEVFLEDIFVVEGMQRGRASSAFAGGVFSPVMDEATHAFHRWVADRLLSKNGKGRSDQTDALPAATQLAEVV